MEKRILKHTSKMLPTITRDSIIGFITRGYGVAIHEVNCPTILNLSSTNKHRLTSASWIHQTQNLYSTDIQLTVIDKQGLLKDVLEQLSKFNINISKASTKLYKSGQAKIYLTCDIQRNKDFQNQANIATI